MRAPSSVTTRSAVADDVDDKEWFFIEIEPAPTPSCHAVVGLQWAENRQWEQQIMLLLSGKVLFARVLMRTQGQRTAGEVLPENASRAP